MTTQSDPLRRCRVPLGGWQPSLVALSAIVDVSSALNAPAMSLNVPQGMHGGHHARVSQQRWRCERCLQVRVHLRVCRWMGMLGVCLINYVLFYLGLRRFFSLSEKISSNELYPHAKFLFPFFFLISSFLSLGLCLSMYRISQVSEWVGKTVESVFYECKILNCMCVGLHVLLSFKLYSYYALLYRSKNSKLPLNSYRLSGRCIFFSLFKRARLAAPAFT